LLEFHNRKFIDLSYDVHYKLFVVQGKFYFGEMLPEEEECNDKISAVSCDK
jgi:hypothetical protein